MTEVPILGQTNPRAQKTSETPCEIVVAGYCPDCEFPIFAYTPSDTREDPEIFRVCECEFTDVEMAIPVEYSSERELDTLTRIFRLVNMLQELYAQTYSAATEAANKLANLPSVPVYQLHQQLEAKVSAFLGNEIADVDEFRTDVQKTVDAIEETVSMEIKSALMNLLGVSNLDDIELVVIDDSDYEEAVAGGVNHQTEA